MGMTFAIAADTPVDRAVLGGKGAGLVEMARLGLPVPPGFVIGTSAGREELGADGTLSAALSEEISWRLADLESAAGRRFGDDADPLLVSVRSGAPVSMPGMMDTILNVGLTAAGTEGLAARTGSERFAYESFERLLDGFARTVRGLSAGTVEEALLGLGAGADARARCDALLGLIASETGAPFPEPAGQLTEAIRAVFGSWNSRRAVAYRRHKGIDDAMGTAVVVQQMVFGNRDERSGSGVGFTRDPSTGASGAFGDFLFQAQGEDVVAGERDTDTLASIADRLPLVHAELCEVFERLERDATDLCDVEFTIESGRLYVLQTRVGQRSGTAAVRIAVALVEEGLIDVATALERVSDEQLEAAAADRFGDEPPSAACLARGLAASPGAAIGLAAFDADRAQALASDGEAVILLRPTTSPVDLPGVLAAAGVVTGRGGRTSHAAVVARGLGRPAVCGVGEITIAADRRSATLGGTVLREGETLSVDGDRGVVSAGAQPLVPASTGPALARFLGWREASHVGSREASHAGSPEASHEVAGPQDGQPVASAGGMPGGV